MVIKTTDYRELGIQTYGHKCEICGNGMVEVHHINYQAHSDAEQGIRRALRTDDIPKFKQLMDYAVKDGFLIFEKNQLSKDDRASNLSVLCGNCHNLIHKLDAGMNLLKVLPPRKMDEKV